jgi:Asp-tRNA(Asn)/Glu-tRNA(Gln) amidotransferase A subunit family amidase
MGDLFEAGIAEIATAVKGKKISPREIVDSYLKRIEQLQPKLNAYVHVDADGARKRAMELEKEIAGGRTDGALLGVPISMKSCIDVEGWSCAAGSRLRADYVAARDAVLVARMRRAGAILLGSTNTPEFLMHYETDNAVRGKTSNPWDVSRSAGGSSGGEAAAIGAGCSMGGIGSDGGGSVRVPAHFCGICALKPTPGRIPTTGHFPPGGGPFPWLGVVGPMARTIADVRAVFDVVKGPDFSDAICAPIEARNLSEKELRGMRVGVLETGALGAPTKETNEAVERAADLLSDEGFSVETVKLEGLEEAIELWWFFFGPMVAQLYAGMVAGREEELSPMFRDYLSMATLKTPATLDEFLSASMRRDEVRARILGQMKEAPILISPVCLAPAFKHGEGNWRPGTGYRDTMRHSQWLNLAGFPGATVPMGFSADKLPIGVQVIGRPNEDEMVLAVAERLEEARGEWKQPKMD